MAGCSETDWALRLNNVCYGVNSKKPILEDASVRIPHGGIYAILGPSGCGKTTLLKVVSRLIVPAKGTVDYCYQDNETRPIPGNGIGYMPQETALIEELSVEENLRLFSSLNLVGDEYEERKKKLMAMLDLEDQGGKLVGNMSGGEKRRLSLVVALLHRPPVVVLDEPTVGVDPLLRQTIWKYLAKLSSEGTTVIITTHYIDEAKDADWICFVRNGRVVAETTPKALQRHYGETDFESCYTKLFRDDEEGHYPLTFTDRPVTVKESRPPVNTTQTITSTPKPLKIYTRRLQALTIRNFHFFRRNIAIVGFVLIISIVQPVLFALLVGSPMKAVKIALANEEQPKLLSAQYLKQLDTHILHIDNYTDQKTAIDRVVDGSHWGAVHIGANFSKCLFRRFREELKVTNSTIDCSSIKVHMDNTNIQILYAVAKELYSAMDKFSKEMLVAVGSSPAIAESPLQFQDPPVYGHFDVSMTEYILPNVIVNLAFMLGAMMTAISLMAEKRSGAIHRVMATGVTRTQLLLSQLLCQMCISFMQVLVMMFVPYVIFSIPIHGSPILGILNMMLFSVCGNAFGLFLSSITDTFEGVLALLNALYFVASTVSGLLWPLEGMPTIMRYIAYFVPLTMQMESFRSVVNRGWGLEHLTVVLGFVSSVVWIVIFMLVSILVFKYRK